MPDRSLDFGGLHVEKANPLTEMSLDIVAILVQYDECKDHRCPTWTVSVAG
jgi:hypothetical protein